MSWGCIQPGPGTEHPERGCNASQTSPRWQPERGKTQLQQGKVHVLQVSPEQDLSSRGRKHPGQHGVTDRAGGDGLDKASLLELRTPCQASN